MAYVVTIADFDGLGGWRASQMMAPGFRSFFLDSIASNMKKNYCEHDAAFVIVNAPWIFPLLHKIVSPVLSAKQRQKIRIIGHADTQDARTFLKAWVPPELLPRSLGGSKDHLACAYPVQTGDSISRWLETCPAHRLGVCYDSDAKRSLETGHIVPQDVAQSWPDDESLAQQSTLLSLSDQDSSRSSVFSDSDVGEMSLSINLASPCSSTWSGIVFRSVVPKEHCPNEGATTLSTPDFQRRCLPEAVVSESREAPRSRICIVSL